MLIHEGEEGRGFMGRKEQKGSYGKSEKGVVEPNSLWECLNCVCVQSVFSKAGKVKNKEPEEM